MNNGTKIFIAEDEETLLDIYVERFKQNNFVVRGFKNGEELLIAISEETPDVLLLDIQMPNMDGYEVLSSIHKNFSDQGKQNVPIIVCSNSNSGAGMKKALDLGAKAFLKKVDYSGQDLVDKVKEILKDSGK